MRLLVITNSYPPALTPRAFRWTAIADHWASQGHHVDVVCAREASTESFEVFNNNGVHVYRVGTVLGKAFRRWIGTPSARCAVDGEGDNATVNRLLLRWFRGAVTRFVREVHDHIWKKLYWPDYACTWYFPARKIAGKLVARHHYDGLISVSLPYTGHLVGLAVKKQMPSLPWVTDIGDPFAYMTETPPNNARLYGWLNYRSESHVLRCADAISVTTEAAMEKYAQVFPVAANKLNVIPPLFSPPGNSAIRAPVFSRETKTRLVFVGTLYRNIRSPETLLLLYARLLKTDLADKLELHFFGTIGDCSSLFKQYANLNGSKIFLHGLVGRDVAMQAMKEADVLINIGNNTIYQLPSKVIEYASLGKPILNITNLERDSSIEFLRWYPGAFCMTKEQLSSDPDQVQKVRKFIINPPLPNQPELDRWLCNFRVEAVARRYEELIAKVSHPDIAR